MGKSFGMGRGHTSRLGPAARGVPISTAIVAELTRPDGCEFRQQCAGALTRTQQGRVGEHGDGLSAAACDR